MLSDNENGTFVAATVSDGGGHRQLEREGTPSEADQCGADGAAGDPVASGYCRRHRDAIPEDASPCADDAVLYSDYDRCDTPMAALDAVYRRVLD